ncbi:FRG domain-containing protein [Ruegeria sp. AU67]|uniref:FRG domain-containing protein n=1 Tax=Ruegeria sp. AU67 TaxID=2108530 RepID=UPI000D68BF01|nr:FRG domain-containing protein [Ruegeria sp. AU67]
METIGSKQIYSFLEVSEHAEIASNTRVRKDTGHLVKSYVDLARKVAELQFRNRDLVFLFRGQRKDYRNKQRNTSLRPTLLRESRSSQAYEKLLRAEGLLMKRYTLTGRDRIARHQALRWSILQHYEVCGTPLLDVTQSLRIAASFATDKSSEQAFVYVLGVPHISGAITAHDDAGLEVIRLSSVCPPEAMRPHLQEGFLLSEYPELASLGQKQHYENHELDFGKRIVAKFVFNPKLFWQKSQAFPLVERDAIYPSGASDPLLSLTQKIKSEIE